MLSVHPLSKETDQNIEELISMYDNLGNRIIQHDNSASDTCSMINRIGERLNKITGIREKKAILQRIIPSLQEVLLALKDRDKFGESLRENSKKVRDVFNATNPCFKKKPSAK